MALRAVPPPRPPKGHLPSTFLARDLPEAIWIGEECIAGPFCVHCGNPLSMHAGDDGRSYCPNRVLHPVFPPPACNCHSIKDTSLS